MKRCEHLVGNLCGALRVNRVKDVGHVLEHVPSLALPKSIADEGTMRIRWSARCIAAEDAEAQRRCDDFTLNNGKEATIKK